MDRGLVESFDEIVEPGEGVAEGVIGPFEIVSSALCSKVMWKKKKKRAKKKKNQTKEISDKRKEISFTKKRSKLKFLLEHLHKYNIN